MSTSFKRPRLAPYGKVLFSISLVMVFLTCAWPVAAQQRQNSSERKELRRREDSLKRFADKIVNSEDPSERFLSDSQFVRVLVRSLKVKYSFYYPFDSLVTISRLVPPDSSFRIFTWQLKKDEHTYLQEGAIQMNQPDGSLKLIPLFDVSMFTAKPLDSVRSNREWIGAIYYRIIQKEFNGRKYYTLLGFDDYNISSNKKWMEVLTFNEAGQPQFGGQYFSFEEDSAVVNAAKIAAKKAPVKDSVKKGPLFRYSMEYKKEALTRFNYDPEMDMVIFDHLIPEGDEPEKKETYVPDGDFEAFKWKGGRWVHVEKLFDFKLKDGDFPQEQKILDEAGGANEQKLMEQTQKNIEKGKKAQPQPVKKTPQ
ncbi:MAG TPA: hypothetical protein VK563_04615 [Puia sp.]|nr:hypothetical protein [Puia sp.]